MGIVNKLLGREGWKVPFPTCSRHKCAYQKKKDESGRPTFICVSCVKEAEAEGRKRYDEYKRRVTHYRDRNPTTCEVCDAVVSPSADMCPNCRTSFK